MDEFVMYFQLGWQHIVAWDGFDHILFIMALCAIYLLKDWRKVIVLVTAFTIGHSITLALSVLSFVHVPGSLIEFLIPVTILVTALANILRKEALPERTRLNYFLALFFGLIHGLGFSNYLKSLLGTQTNIVKPLLAFNLGLEFGQLLVVTVILLAAGIVVNLAGINRRNWNLYLSATIFLCALVLSIGQLKELIVS